MATFSCVLQYPREKVLAGGFPYKGKWNGGFFRAPAPLVLELGCGRGEYTVGLALADSSRNHIGVDIKGARMWSGASEVERREMTNAAFLRCEIENIDLFSIRARLRRDMDHLPRPTDAEMSKTSHFYTLPQSLPPDTDCGRDREPQDGFTVLI